MLTAVIPHYNRTNAIQAVLESLSACPAIDDIIIWQSGEALENRWGKRLTLLGEPGQNEFTWGRFLAARQAKHRLIYTQDDDCIVTPDAIARLAGLALDSGRWACYLDAGHMGWVGGRYVFNGKFVTLHDALLGWGSVFQKERLAVFDKYLAGFPMDEFFK